MLNRTRLQEAIVEHARRLEQTGTSSPSFTFLLLSRGYLSADQLATLQEDDQAPIAPACQEPPAPASPPAIPDQSRTFGKYTIVRELGRGSMGEVIEGLDPTLGRRVAIKRPFLRSRGSAATPKDEERFLREAEVAVMLPRHPYLVEVYEAGRIEGQCYIAMEVVDGLAMSEWRKTATLSQELDAILQVAAGIHHAHQYGVIHRDLKPGNVMIRTDGRAVVTDFGVAKSSVSEQVSLTPFGIMIGSPGYMSPEQARCLKTVDRRTDIYSLGVMLYQSLTGRKPFEGRSAMEILLRMVQEPVRRPTEIMRAGLNPLLYQELEKVCLKALQKNPRDRHDSAKAFADELVKSLEPLRHPASPSQ